MTDAVKPQIGFRVVVSGGEPRLHSPMECRHPRAEATAQTLLDHLTWKRKPSPFVSLWTSWPRAFRWANDRAGGGARDVDIWAVWIGDRADVYDAYDAATRLPLPPNKKPLFHCDEVVVVGLDERSILARFRRVTERHWNEVLFVMGAEDQQTSSTRLPLGLSRFETDGVTQERERREAIRWRGDGSVVLRDEIKLRMGSRDVRTKALLLAEELLSARDFASDELMAQLEELNLYTEV